MKNWKDFPSFFSLKEKGICGICGIYAIVNMANEKVYVGKTTNMKRRIRDHFTHLRGGHYRKINPHLQNAFDLYGEESFAVILLETCHGEGNLRAAEHKWMENCRSAEREFGYNTLKYDERLHYLHSQESIEKMRLAKLGRRMPQKVREKIRRANKGRHLAGYGAVMPQYVKDKLSKALKGRKYVQSEERCRNISKALTGKKQSAEHRKASSKAHTKPDYRFNKKVIQMDLGGNVLNEFYSQGEAARVVGGCTKSNISHCCNGDQKTAGGFKWKLAS